MAALAVAALASTGPGAALAQGQTQEQDAPSQQRDLVSPSQSGRQAPPSQTDSIDPSGGYATTPRGTRAADDAAAGGGQMRQPGQTPVRTLRDPRAVGLNPMRDLRAEDRPQPSEFERMVSLQNGGTPVWRLGTRLRRSDDHLLSYLELPARVPPGYVVQVGDEVSVTVWGGIDGQWLLRVDRAGRITLPRVGPVAVAGAAAADLPRLLRERLSGIFKGFDVAAAVTDPIPMRVHITGFVERPGDYTVPGLTTISSAVALAQGPSAGGSYRRIRLLRGDDVVTSFDLYALLGSGSRRDDRMLQPGDVLFVDALGPQVAVLGSVNRTAVFEFLPGETVADALRLAGGFSSVAERSLLTVERLRNRSNIGAVEIEWPQGATMALADGDVLRVRSQVLAEAPSQTRNKRVLVEGEVRQPGEYLLPAQATLAQAVEAAGGFTSQAFAYGVALRRESVRMTQEANYDRALRELEAEFTRSVGTRRAPDESSANAQIYASQLIARLRERRPEGRVVLDVQPEATGLPDVELETGDRISVPPLNQSVGVFGSVFSSGSFRPEPGRNLDYYVKRAGGPTAGADYSLAFVVRANGSVVSASSGAGWFRAHPFERQPALPGDTLFVPEDLYRSSFVQNAKDWTQILYQLGIGLAAFGAIR